MPADSFAEFQGNQNESSAKSGGKKERIFETQDVEDGAEEAEDVVEKNPNGPSTTKARFHAGVDAIPAGISAEERGGVGGGVGKSGGGGVSEGAQLTLVSMTTEATEGDGVTRRTTDRRNGGNRKRRRNRGGRGFRRRTALDLQMRAMTSDERKDRNGVGDGR